MSSDRWEGRVLQCIDAHTSDWWSASTRREVLDSGNLNRPPLAHRACSAHAALVGLAACSSSGGARVRSQFGWQGLAGECSGLTRNGADASNAWVADSRRESHRRRF